MEEAKSVLITNKDPATKTLPTIPMVAKAKGNVPTSEEYDALVTVVNKIVIQLKGNGMLK